MKGYVTPMAMGSVLQVNPTPLIAIGGIKKEALQQQETFVINYPFSLLGSGLKRMVGTTNISIMT